ncbi:MAG: helix-turn-helix domain-containing protein [Actinomycetia bacterium]|nr:helix-turn-helix domain-containing protein [Actinomycetes bacterium]MCP4224824.1 helix-turn-helix domain-containing protein [Actinomycetes bacterium]MCP5034474.1 helix-turn-helix domain-containing protein [Actinomycetes bacterium]
MTAPQAVERPTYSVDEVAEILGISRSLAYECVKTGEIPSVRFRRLIVVPASCVEALLQGPNGQPADVDASDALDDLNGERR